MLESVRLADLELMVFPLGDGAVLLRPRCQLERASTLPRLGRAILDAALPDVVEVIATPSELCLVAADHPATLLETLNDRRWTLESSEIRRFELPVFFDRGGDWDEVQRQTGLGRDGYLQRLRSLTFEVAMYGFLPGFVYLAGLPEDLRCRRKETPATRVEPGSLAVGGPWIGVYGVASPGGWQVLGRTPLRLASPRDRPPTLLAVGDSVRLRAISSEEYESLVAEPPTLGGVALDAGANVDDD